MRSGGTVPVSFDSEIMCQLCASASDFVPQSDGCCNDAPQRALRTSFRCIKCGGRETSVRYAIAGEAPPGYGSRGKAVWPEPLSMHYLEPRSSGHFGEIDYSPVLGSIRFDDTCNLYSNTRSRDAVRALFRVSDNHSYAFEPMPAIFPKSVAPIIRLATAVQICFRSPENEQAMPFVDKPSVRYHFALSSRYFAEIFDALFDFVHCRLEFWRRYSCEQQHRLRRDGVSP